MLRHQPEPGSEVTPLGEGRAVRNAGFATRKRNPEFIIATPNVDLSNSERHRSMLSKGVSDDIHSLAGANSVEPRFMDPSRVHVTPRWGCS